MKKFLYFSIAVLFWVLSGCREEIIDPFNPATNVNEPVQTRTSNSYSFILNAQDINTELQNFTDLYSRRNRILITAEGYKVGYLDILIFDENKVGVFEARISSDESGLYSSIIGSIPERVVLSFTNFTGRFKIQISPLY